MNKSRLIVFISMIIIIISTLGIISAADVSNNTDVSGDMNDDTGIDTANHNNPTNTKEDTGSLSNLGDEFDKNVVNLTRDYKYDEEEDGDFEDIGLSGRKNLIINGNNHTIDLGNHSVLFDIYGSTVELNNLIIKNFYDSAIIADGSEITSTNVTYINEIDTNSARAVTLTNSTFTSYNDKFINNFNKIGASIYASDKSAVYLENSTFTNKNHPEWGVLYVTNTGLTVVNSTFNNITSEYCTAIYMESCSANLTGSTFINLKSNKTAGAIGIKRLIDAIDIDNCKFINVSSKKKCRSIIYR